MSPTHAVQAVTRVRFEPTAPGAGPPAPGEAHLWRADLDRLAETHEPDVLCEQELERAGRIATPTAAARWSRSRAILRLLLARYTGLDPRALALAHGAHGKPALAHGGLAFNLSHSGPLALYVFSADGEVGVDVEVVRERSRSRSLAVRVLGPAQARRLDALPRAERQIELLRAWVSREACAKCSGAGVLAGAQSERTGDQVPALVEIDLGAEALAALACRPRAREVRCFDWPSRPADARIPFFAA